nr:hypothetical protein [Gammaproteobacteria bacterium]
MGRDLCPSHRQRSTDGLVVQPRRDIGDEGRDPLERGAAGPRPRRVMQLLGGFREQAYEEIGARVGAELDAA